MSKNPFSSWSTLDVELHNARVSGKPILAHKPTSKAVESENDLHKEIIEYCERQGWLYIHARMDMPSTIQVGHPDLSIFMPGRKVVFIECKARKSKTSDEQLIKVAHARKLGFVAEIVDNFGDALAAINKAQQIC